MGSYIYSINNMDSSELVTVTKTVNYKVTFVRTRSLSNAITFSIQPTWRPHYEVM